MCVNTIMILVLYFFRRRLQLTSVGSIIPYGVVMVELLNQFNTLPKELHALGQILTKKAYVFLQMVDQAIISFIL